MAYGRYEKGEREPSYPSVCFMAQVFRCSTDFLYGISDNPTADSFVISRSEDPTLYALILEVQNNENLKNRLLAYARKLKRIFAIRFATCS